MSRLSVDLGFQNLFMALEPWDLGPRLRGNGGFGRSLANMAAGAPRVAII